MKTNLLDAGALRHRIAIQYRAEEQDSDTGDILYTWVTVAGMSSVPAEVVPLSAREFVASAAPQSRIVARIRIRYMAGITAKMRAIYNGLPYNIEGVLADPYSGRQYLTLPVSEGTDAG